MAAVTDIIKVEIEDEVIDVKNPDKLFWPEAGVTKLEFVKTMTRLAPFLIKYSKTEC